MASGSWTGQPFEVELSGTGIETLFEDWNQIPSWPRPNLGGAGAIADHLNGHVAPNAWLSIAHFTAGAWLVTFSNPPLPIFNTLTMVTAGLDYRIFVSDLATIR